MQENDIDKLCDKINMLVVDFLSTHGGLSNGYATYIEGEISESYTDLDWSTPKLGGYTIDNKNHYSRGLVGNILLATPPLFFSKYKITFEKEHIESGCFATTLYISKIFIIDTGRVK